MNSTYLECADRSFAEKGGISAVALLGLMVCVPMLLFLPETWQAGLGVRPSNEDPAFTLTVAFFATLLLPALIWGLVWLLRRDAFTFTHLPMRFQRLSRTVYVYRPGGVILSAPWDDLFVTLGYQSSGGSTNAEVIAHVLAADRTTVLETFGLSHLALKDPQSPALAGGAAIHPDSIYAQWEFVRRYMNEGPQAVMAEVKQCRPVDRHRERSADSFRFLAEAWSGGHTFLRAVLLPFWGVGGLFRMLAMQTSSIPKWPDGVEAACPVEHGDPYAVEGTLGGSCVAVFPGAARATAARPVGDGDGPDGPEKQAEQRSGQAPASSGVGPESRPRRSSNQRRKRAWGR